MSFRLFSYFFVLTLAALACEGNARNYLRNPNYRDLYYRNQFNGGLSNPNPAPIRVPTDDGLARSVEEIQDYYEDENDNNQDESPGQEKVLSEDIYTFIPGSEKIKRDPNNLRPILYSMSSQLRQVMRSLNESQVTNKNILYVLKDTLAWAQNQAASFYSLISTISKSR